MSAMRLFVLVCAATLAMPAFAVDRAPYEGVGTGGPNNILDASPLGACWDAGANTGCRDIWGNQCPTNGPCRLERVPAGRCSRGTSNTCIWPSGGGICQPGDANQACVTSADCTSVAGDTCNTGSLSAACACSSTNLPVGAPVAPSETFVCTQGATAPNLGVCSDGDDEATFGGTLQNKRLGAEGTALCVVLNTGSDTITSCGLEGGANLKGTLWAAENPPVTPTPQRQPGGAGLDTGDILDVEAGPLLIEWGSVQANGIRSFATQGESFWNDWTFGQKQITGGAVSSTIVTLYCDIGDPGDPNKPNRGPGEPFEPALGQTGTCVLGGGNCVTHQQCAGEDLCGGLTYCYTSANALDQPGFLYTANVNTMGVQPFF
jgi:hypothetical protein